MALSNLSQRQFMCRMNRRHRKKANLEALMVNERGIVNKTSMKSRFINFLKII